MSLNHVSGQNKSFSSFSSKVLWLHWSPVLQVFQVFQDVGTLYEDFGDIQTANIYNINEIITQTQEYVWVFFIFLFF